MCVCFQEELYGLEGRSLSPSLLDKQQVQEGVAAFSLSDPECPCHYGRQWAYLQFEQPVTAPKVGAAVLLLCVCVCCCLVKCVVSVQEAVGVPSV
jgi:hypothetical protein